MTKHPLRTTSQPCKPGLDSVDIIAEAYRQAQESRSSRADLSFIAPAKINLSLLVGPLKDNGFHAVDTVMQTLSLHDTLSFKILPAQDLFNNEDQAADIYLDQAKRLPFKLTVQWQSELLAITIPVEKNLVTKALQALAQEFPDQAFCGFELHLKKRIPAAGGLGGGSADAAAALRAAAHVWGISEADPKFQALAQGLGRDLPFFLQGGCAHYSGEGEVFVRKLDSSKLTLVLFKPDQGVSTPKAYKRFDERGVVTPASQIKCLERAQNASEVDFVNNLQEIAWELVPEIRELQDKVKAQAGVQTVMLSGSGSASFAVCEDLSTALQIVSKCKQWGCWACVTTSVPLGAVKI